MLEGKVVAITGASAGVGRAIAREFGKHGAQVGLIARGIDGLEAAKREIESLGGKAIVLKTDVADSTQVEAAANELEKQFGKIDIWINDAMVSVFSPAKDMEPEEYKRVTDVTYLGYVYGTLAALKRMLPRNEGVIIQIGSALAYRSIPLQSAYCAAKHAILGFTESLRSELLHDGTEVRVSMVELPAVNTPQFGWVKSRLPNKAQPVPPIFQPEVIARAALFAATHKRREVKVGFSTIKAILAEKLAPGLADRYLASRGYTSQQTSEPRDPNQPYNLWKPVPGDHGAHGTFGHRARRKSWQLFATEYRPLLFSALGFGLLFLGTADWIHLGGLRGTLLEEPRDKIKDKIKKEKLKKAG